MKILKVLFVCFLVILAIAFLKYRSVKKAIAEHANFAPPPESVTTVIAKEEVWQETLSLIASLEAVQGVTLSAEEAGKIVKINFESGAIVKAGDVLLEIDTAAEQAQLRSAEARLELARVNLQRARTLRPTNAVSQSDLDNWTFQSKQYEADANAVRATIAKKTITAPFSGRTGIRLVNLGQFVKQGDSVVPLFAVDSLHVNFSVPQQQLRNVVNGQKVIVNVDAFPNEHFEASVTAINPQVNESTRNAEVQATLPNPQEKLRPGMYATASLLLNQTNTVIPLPGSSISYAPYGNSVFVVEPTKTPDGKEVLSVRQQFIKVGSARGDQVGIVRDDKSAERGLKPGDQVVTSGTFKLRPGGQVLVNNTVTPGNDPNPKPADT